MESRIAGTVAHSFDFDGMFASTKYTTKLRSLIFAAAAEDRALDMQDYHQLANYIYQEYKELFDRHFARNPQAEHFIYVGSDRQDHKTDLDNGFKSTKGLHVTLSCFPFFTALTKVLSERYPQTKITLADLLLEDVYRQLPTGTSFKNISSAWLNLDKSFYQKLAVQLENYDSDESHKLFMELRKLISDPNLKPASRNSLLGSSEYVELAVSLQEPFHGTSTTTTPVKNSPQSPRLPKYKDSGKLLIIITQILDANDRQGKGKIDVDYHLTDDRRDILTHANTSLCSEKMKRDNSAERKTLFLKPKFTSQLSEAPTTVLSLIPDTTHVFLEQYIPIEEKEKLQEADPHRFGDFVQTEEIVGTGKGARKINEIFSDIHGAHSLLNMLADGDPVPGAIIQTVENNAQNNALLLINLCVKDLKNSQPPTKLLSDPAYKAIDKILDLLEKHPLGNDRMSRETLLEKIQSISASILPTKNAPFLDFNRTYPDHALFFKELASINPKNPRTDSLNAIYYTLKSHADKTLTESGDRKSMLDK